MEKKPDDTLNLTRKIGGGQMRLIARYFSAYFLVYIDFHKREIKHENAAIKTV